MAGPRSCGSALLISCRSKPLAPCPGRCSARLLRIAEHAARNPNSALPAAPRLKAGSRLLRRWRGEVHEVTVLGEGIAYRGTTYGTLSEIARVVTGTRWSGPAFFGLTKGRSQ